MRLYGSVVLVACAIWLYVGIAALARASGDEPGVSVPEVASPAVARRYGPAPAAARVMQRCETAGQVVYQYMACPGDGAARPFANGAVNAWRWSSVRAGPGRAGPARAMVSTDAGSSGPGMGPANSPHYRSCSGVTCPMSRKGVQ